MLEVQNLYAGYDKRNPIIKGLSFEIGQGDNVLVVGENGSGKSTLAKAIMGVLPYCEGTLKIDGEDISDLKTYERQKKGIVWLMQYNTVFPNLTVQENINLALSDLPKLEREERLSTYSKWITKIGRNKKAAFLSGGERRLLSIFLVLCSNLHYKCLILDEPSAGVAQLELQNLVNSFDFVVESIKSSVILIEHNQLMISEFKKDFTLEI